MAQMFRARGNGLNGHSAPADKTLIEQYNKSRLNDGPHRPLCLAPFANMYFGNQGRVSACCYNRHHLLGTYPEQSLLSIWRGEKADELRSKLAKNDLSGGCGSCESLIKSKNFDAVIARNYDLLPVNPSFPSKLEFELSNTCNLECAMCFGEFSSSIRKNRDKLPAIKSPYGADFVKQLEPFIPHLHSARFFGGEPFLINLYYEIWEMIIALNPNCPIVVQTNGTVLNNRVKNLLEKGNFTVNISIDSLQKNMYETIRKNAKFESVMEHIRYFHQYCMKKGTNLGVSVCPMPLNWNELPGFIAFCNELDAYVYFNTVWYPEELSFAHQSQGKLEEVLVYLKTFEHSENTPLQKSNKRHYLDFVKQVKAWLDMAKQKEKEQRLERNRRRKTAENIKRKLMLVKTEKLKLDLFSIKEKINSLILRNGKQGSLNNSLVQAYNGSREWGAQKKLCYAPFSSLFISSLGMVRPCYANRVNVQYPDKGLSEIWFGSQFNKLRKKMDRNDLSGDCEFCDSCIKSNDFGSLLAKKYDNPQYHNDTLPSKSNKIYPRIIEFELDNTCNLECIMCDGNLSSAIRKNREKRPPLPKIYDDLFLKQLETFIPHLKVAEFAGGAPFLINIYYKIWDMIIDVNPKCEILITTSANTLNDKIKKLIARGRFNFNISIDSLQKENYEKIRVNGNFERVMENIRFYLKYCEKKTTSLCILVCPLRQNWRELPDFIRFADKLGVPVHFHVVFKPYHLALWSLPPTNLYEIHEYLSGFVPDTSVGTAVNKMNWINYTNLVKQIDIWYEKAVIREKKEEAKEQVLARKIEVAKNLFYENLRKYIFKEEKIHHIKTQINTVLNSLPNTVPPEIIFTELAKYRISEVVYTMEHSSGGELIKKAEDLYNNLYSGLRDSAFSIKYANDNEKYRLNMQY